MEATHWIDHPTIKKMGDALIAFDKWSAEEPLTRSGQDVRVYFDLCVKIRVAINDYKTQLALKEVQ